MLLPQIETERLFLRTYKQSDLETVYLLCSDPHVTHFFPDYYSVKKEDVLESLPRRREKWRANGFGQFGVFEKNTGKLIGYCGLQYLDKTSEVEIYYGYFKQYWKQGFASEAAKAVLRFGFEQIKLEKIVAVTNPENIMSQKVLLRLGMLRGDDRKFYEVDAAYFYLNHSDFNNSDMFYNLIFEQVETEKE